MCGIVGTVNFSCATFSIEESYLENMRDTMIHRGPDGSGLWISKDKAVGFGHRRLSIVDLSDLALQPMRNEDDSVVLTFNGEIYNHAELRIELEQNVSEWVTDHSDTEVLLRAYETWGIKCVDKLRGMFAFAIWDANLNKVFLVRDRMGIKPLYYAEHSGRLTFASEIKALLADPGQKREVNEDGLFHYLSFLTTPAPMTMFKDIFKLSPGTYMEIDVATGDKAIHRYYEMWDDVSENTGNDNVEAEILSRLREAVNLRKVGDVPVGVFLSGGIDSSTNAALFSEGGDVVKTFSIGYEGEYDSYVNELEFAKSAAAHVGAEYHEKLLTQKDLLDFLPKMVTLQDEPMADPVCVPVYYVSKLARDNGVIVCQVGEGADELFFGYPTWKLKWQLQKAADIPFMRPFKKLLAGIMRATKMDKSHQYEALQRSIDGRPVFWGGAEAFTHNGKLALLSPRLREKYSGRNSWEVIEPVWQRFQDKAWEKSTLHWMTYLDLTMRLPELLLMRVDKMSMGVSLEGRVPFLDHKFVEYVLSLPEKRKILPGVLKGLLKKAVRGLIPNELIDRKKQGFGVPVYEWVYDELGEQIRQDLKEFCQQTDYLSYDDVIALFDRGGADVWYVYNFVLWWNCYIRDYEVQEQATA